MNDTKDDQPTTVKPVQSPEKRSFGQIPDKLAFNIMLASIVIMPFIIFPLVSRFHTTTPTKPSDDPFMAEVMAQGFVKKRLKSPATARFGHEGDINANVTKRDDGVYVVKGWVDSQNGFGAVVRTHYVVLVKYVGMDTWELVGAPLLVQQ